MKHEGHKTLTGFRCKSVLAVMLLPLIWIWPLFRSSRAWDATHTTVTFLPKYQRNSAPTATPAVQVSATPGSNGWKQTIASVRKTWGKKTAHEHLSFSYSVPSARYDCFNTTFLTVCSSSGTDRVDFKFYYLLEQILDKQPSTSSTVITDSIEISEDSNGESVTETGKKSIHPLSAAKRRVSVLRILWVNSLYKHNQQINHNPLNSIKN